MGSGQAIPASRMALRKSVARSVVMFGAVNLDLLSGKIPKFVGEDHFGTPVRMMAKTSSMSMRTFLPKWYAGISPALIFLYNANRETFKILAPSLMGANLGVLFSIPFPLLCSRSITALGFSWTCLWYVSLTQTKEGPFNAERVPKLWMGTKEEGRAFRILE